ncbi:MAG: hypothetical protein ACK502_10735 [Alphaproteobacteria bacterium]
MRDYGRVPTNFWLMTFETEDVRTLVLYAMCGPHSNGIGCYRLPLSYIAEDLRWDTARASQALRVALTQGLLEYDDKALWIRVVKHFESSPVESPNAAKSFIPLIQAVPKNSHIYLKLIADLEQFKHRFPKGLLEGLRSPTLSPCLAEAAAEQQQLKKDNNNLLNQSLRDAKNVDKSDITLNLQDFDTAAVVLSKMIGRRSLTAEDKTTLMGWIKRFDIERDVLPYLERRAADYSEKNAGVMPTHPLTYFHAGVSEHFEKSRLK